MPLKIVKQDITKIKCDAIVNPTDREYSHSGGTDYAIHEAAGPELYSACAALEPLDVGKAVITSAFGLPCRYVIHTAGPRWEGGAKGEEALLRSCYRNIMALAIENGCESLAVPLISSGTFGFPKDCVLKIAVEEISKLLYEYEMLVYIIIYDKDAYSISERLLNNITSFIQKSRRPFPRDVFSVQSSMVCESAVPFKESLEDMLKNMDKGFAETLFEYIDKKGITDVECYKRANVDKKTFSKIKCNKDYKPGKITVVSFAIALHLNLKETNHLLNTVGMSLSRSSVFDTIIEYFVKNGDYKDIFEVNETLYKFDQATLGV